MLIELIALIKDFTGELSTRELTPEEETQKIQAIAALIKRGEELITALVLLPNRYRTYLVKRAMLLSGTDRLLEQSLITALNAVAEETKDVCFKALAPYLNRLIEKIPPLAFQAGASVSYFVNTFPKEQQPNCINQIFGWLSQTERAYSHSEERRSTLYTYIQEHCAEFHNVITADTIALTLNGTFQPRGLRHSYTTYLTSQPIIDCINALGGVAYLRDTLKLNATQLGELFSRFNEPSSTFTFIMTAPPALDPTRVQISHLIGGLQYLRDTLDTPKKLGQFLNGAPLRMAGRLEALGIIPLLSPTQKTELDLLAPAQKEAWLAEQQLDPTKLGQCLNEISLANFSRIPPRLRKPSDLTPDERLCTVLDQLTEEKEFAYIKTFDDNEGTIKARITAKRNRNNIPTPPAMVSDIAISLDATSATSSSLPLISWQDFAFLTEENITTLNALEFSQQKIAKGIFQLLGERNSADNTAFILQKMITQEVPEEQDIFVGVVLETIEEESTTAPILLVEPTPPKMICDIEELIYLLRQSEYETSSEEKPITQFESSSGEIARSASASASKPTAITYQYAAPVTSSPLSSLQPISWQDFSFLTEENTTALNALEPLQQRVARGLFQLFGERNSAENTALILQNIVLQHTALVMLIRHFPVRLRARIISLFIMLMKHPELFNLAEQLGRRGSISVDLSNFILSDALCNFFLEYQIPLLTAMLFLNDVLLERLSSRVGSRNYDTALLSTESALSVVRGILARLKTLSVEITPQIFFWAFSNPEQATKLLDAMSQNDPTVQKDIITLVGNHELTVTYQLVRYVLIRMKSNESLDSLRDALQVPDIHCLSKVYLTLNWQTLKHFTQKGFFNEKNLLPIMRQPEKTINELDYFFELLIQQELLDQSNLQSMLDKTPAEITAIITYCKLVLLVEQKKNVDKVYIHRERKITQEQLRIILNKIQALEHFSQQGIAAGLEYFSQAIFIVKVILGSFILFPELSDEDRFEGCKLLTKFDLTDQLRILDALANNDAQLNTKVHEQDLTFFQAIRRAANIPIPAKEVKHTSDKNSAMLAHTMKGKQALLEKSREEAHIWNDDIRGGVDNYIRGNFYDETYVLQQPNFVATQVAPTGNSSITCCIAAGETVALDHTSEEMQGLLTELRRMMKGVRFNDEHGLLDKMHVTPFAVALGGRTPKDQARSSDLEAHFDLTLNVNATKEQDEGLLIWVPGTGVIAPKILGKSFGEGLIYKPGNIWWGDVKVEAYLNSDFYDFGMAEDQQASNGDKLPAGSYIFMLGYKFKTTEDSPDLPPPQDALLKKEKRQSNFGIYHGSDENKQIAYHNLCVALDRPYSENDNGLTYGAGERGSCGNTSAVGATRQIDGKASVQETRAYDEKRFATIVRAQCFRMSAVITNKEKDPREIIFYAQLLTQLRIMSRVLAKKAEITPVESASMSSAEASSTATMLGGTLGTTPSPVTLEAGAAAQSIPVTPPVVSQPSARGNSGKQTTSLPDQHQQSRLSPT